MTRLKGIRRFSAFILLLAAMDHSIWAADSADGSRFAVTNSRNQYVHWIELYDAKDQLIDPSQPNAPPYSPQYTCGRCHDYATMAHGYHFNARPSSAANESTGGPAGEPWIWVDTRTGTQLPLSYRGWPGTYHPGKIGISEFDFVRQFGRHLPGGWTGDAVASEASPGGSEPPTPAPESPTPESTAASPAPSPPATPSRWKLSGSLPIDCMACHSGTVEYSGEAWRDQIARQNFAWAPAAAIGLATVEGSVAELPDDFDPSRPAEGGPTLPATKYSLSRLRGDKKVFFDVVRTPSNNACYYCHSTQQVGTEAPSVWNCDQDVHIQAGMRCADCHRNDLAHHTVRGYEGERHPTGESVASLSCRGCHLGDDADRGQRVGRLGAPRPLHVGLPALHLEKLSCTSCHSGPVANGSAAQIQSAMAHGLGLPSHEFSANAPPVVVAPALLSDSQVIYPYRMTWPAFWGKLSDNEIRPLHPEAANDALRRVLRIRRGTTFSQVMSEGKLTSEERSQALGAERAAVPDEELNSGEQEKLAAAQRAKAATEFRKKLADALKALAEASPGVPGVAVYVTNGRGYRLDDAGAVEEFEHPAANAYAWRLGHDVRPARMALGANGCFDCHRQGAAFLDTKITAAGPAPDPAPIERRNSDLAGIDRQKWDTWSLSFRGRAAFKYAGFVAMAAVAWVLLSVCLVGPCATCQGAIGRLARGAVHLLFVGSVVVLSVTALVPVALGHELEGWRLFVHMGAAGAFVFLLPVFAWFYSGSTSDTDRSNQELASAAPNSPLRQLAFVVVLAGGLVVTVTMLVSMLPWFGTDGLNTLLDVHRYSGMVTGVATLVHAILVIAAVTKGPFRSAVKRDRS